MLSEEDLIKNKHKVIWLSDFYYSEASTQKGQYDRNGTAKDIVVVGNDRVKILTNPMFVKRVYENVYGKEKWLKKYDEKTLSIKRIVLKKPISLSFAPEYR